jgi:hypothetical protein
MNPEELLTLARELVRQGGERGVTLRLLGHLAVRDHTHKYRDLIDQIGRVPTHDIDFMGYSEQETEADHMFKEMNYKPDRAVAFSQEYGLQRLIYHHPQEEIIAEIFLDQLRMAHTIDLRGRLELDSPTISLIDLLLSKLQIQQITEKDLKDMIVLCAEHDLGSGDREKIDIDHLIDITSQDWGFWYTAINNLRKVLEWLDKIDVLYTETRDHVDTKVKGIIDRMETCPKSLKWRLRARVGTRVKWYDDVGEVLDIYH